MLRIYCCFKLNFCSSATTSCLNLNFDRVSQNTKIAVEKIKSYFFILFYYNKNMYWKVFLRGIIFLIIHIMQFKDLKYSNCLE